MTKKKENKLTLISFSEDLRMDQALESLRRSLMERVDRNPIPPSTPLNKDITIRYVCVQSTPSVHMSDNTKRIIAFDFLIRET